MISTLSRSLSLAFSRIQFTPDLMPADITGTEVIEENRTTGGREFKFLAGHAVRQRDSRVDEINRTPPKTQAALLEAMQERQVTVGRVRHRLDAPFFVLATQNPIEQEGTYPLPEAQQDRFMFKVFVRYPKFDEEFDIARRTTSLRPPRKCRPFCPATRSSNFQNPGSPRAGVGSRHPLHAGPGSPDAHRRAGRAEVHPRLAVLGRWSSSGAVPDHRRQGSGACSMAGSTSRSRISRRSPIPVLEVHRILTNFTAASEGISPDTVIKKLIEETPSKESELTRDEQLSRRFSRPEAND